MRKYSYHHLTDEETETERFSNLSSITQQLIVWLDLNLGSQAFESCLSPLHYATSLNTQFIGIL